MDFFLGITCEEDKLRLFQALQFLSVATLYYDSRDPRELSLGQRLKTGTYRGRWAIYSGSRWIEARQWSTAESTTSVCSMNLLEFSKRSGERVVYFLLVGDNEDMAAVWLKRDMYAREIRNEVFVKFTTNFLANVFRVFTRNISCWLISLFIDSPSCRLLLSYRATTNQPKFLAE